jgi:hypothetical protein
MQQPRKAKMPFVWLYSSRKMTELGFGGKHFSSFFVVVKRRHLEKTTNARLRTTSSILKSEKRYIETAAKRQLAESSRKKKDTSESYVPLAKIPTTPSADSGDGSVVATPPPDLGLQIGAQRHHPRTRRRRPAEGRHDTRKLKKKDPPEDVIFQKTDVARDDELSVAVLDLPSCDSSVGSHEPPTAQIDKVRRRMPPGRHRKERKSLESRSPEIQRDELALLDDVDYSGLPKHLFYWDTLGETRTRGVDFSWPTDVGSFLGYREKVGRVYYRSFTLRGHKYTVGDFVWKTESEERGVYRILSAFQATKSYMGYWSKKREHQKEELQKRGKRDESLPYHNLFSQF